MLSRWSSLLCVFILAGAARPALACGFKMVGDIRPPRLAGVNKTAAPMRIVLYRNPEAEPTKFLDRQFQQLLQRVGHNVRLVTNLEELKAGGYDMVLFHAGDEDSLRESSGAKSAIYVPVTDEVTENLKKKYELILNPSKRASQYLPQLELMGRRAGGGGV